MPTPMIPLTVRVTQETYDKIKDRDPSTNAWVNALIAKELAREARRAK